MMPRSVGRANQNGDRALAGWEILSVITSCLIAEWVVLAFVGNSKVVAAIPVTLALAFMIYSHRERGENLNDIGFRFDNFVAAARLLVIPTIVTCVLILLLTWFMKGREFSFAPFRLRFLTVPFWALFQQYVLQGFINRRAQLALGSGLKSILLMGVIFSLVHLPNPMLGIITLIGGVVWAAVYQRQPNLFALALSHSIVSVLLALSLPQDLVYNLRVGFKYFG